MNPVSRLLFKHDCCCSILGMLSFNNNIRIESSVSLYLEIEMENSLQILSFRGTKFQMYQQCTYCFFFLLINVNIINDILLGINKISIMMTCLIYN